MIVEETLDSTLETGFLLSKLLKLQEFQLKCKNYSNQKEISSSSLIRALSKCTNLVLVRFVNQRFAGNAASDF